MSFELQQAFEQGVTPYQQAEQTKDKAEALKLLETAQGHFQEYFRLAEEIDNTWGQCIAQYWLGSCVYRQAERAADKAEALKLFVTAESHFQEYFRLAEDKRNQCIAQNWLGCCVYAQAKRTADKVEALKLFTTAEEHFQEYLRLAEEIDDKQNQSFAQNWLGRCLYKQAEYTEQPNEKLEELFNFQKESIQSDFLNILNKNGKTADSVQNSIIEILTVLNICPYELEGLPLAHYTSPYVAELLFGIKDKDKDSDTDKEEDKDNNKIKAQPMRMNISAYMNDPYEGKSLLDFVGQTKLDVENKARPNPYAAFFSCFSSRVNDLNQFRLYGKENNVEASGCCLVFNQDKNFVGFSDLQASFTDLGGNQKAVVATQNAADGGKDTHNLFQVAYLAYKDKYTQFEAFNQNEVRKLNNDFFVYLKQIGHQPHHRLWHKLRLNKLRAALNKLQQQIEAERQKQKKHQKPKSKIDETALETVRFLFKDFAFRDEEEFRCLKIKKLDAPEVKCCNKSNNLYLEYGLVTDKVDEIILGTNYENTETHRRRELFRYQIMKKYPNIKVSYSSLPINPK